MINRQIENNYTQVVNILIFIFPVVIISLQVAGDIVLFILAMIGIFIAISQKLLPFTIKEIKVYSYLTIGYFTAVCLSVFFSGQAAELAHYIPRDSYYLFAPFIALALYKAEINVNYLLTGIKVSLLILGVIVFNELLSQVERPSGVINATVFGNLAVSLFFVVLVFLQHESFKYKVLSLLSLMSGLFIIVVSGTRGAWVSFLLLLGVYLYFVFKQRVKLRTSSKVITVLIIASVIYTGSISQLIHDRANYAYTQISSWVQGDKHPTSVGLRLEIYSKAINNIENVPFFGHGYRTSNVILFQNDSSHIGKILVGYNHLHNAYLTNYYNGGVPLLGALLFLLFAPLRIFIKAHRQNRYNPIFISGILLTLGYASYGMVNILLGDTYMNGFYVFFLAIFLLLTNKSIKTPED